MRLTKKVISAVEAVLDIAYHAGGEPVQSADITRRQGIPRRYLEPVLQRLVRNGLLIATRGPRGGYRLARERRRTSVGEIVRIVREMETATDPLTDDQGSALGATVLNPIWEEVQEQCMQKLDKITLEDLCTSAQASGGEAEAKAPVDFAI